MNTDPIADMLTRIRNANTSKHKTVDIPASKMKLGITEILFKHPRVLFVHSDVFIKFCLAIFVFN